MHPSSDILKSIFSKINQLVIDRRSCVANTANKVYHFKVEQNFTFSSEEKL